MNNIKNLIKVSLSSDQVLDSLDGKANLIRYPDLKNYNSIDELLSPYGLCVILFLTAEHYGHWILISKLLDGSGLVEVFDSYGTYPEEQRKYQLNDWARNAQRVPLLSRLLIESPYEISYNEHRFQKRSPSVATCGRFVIIRALLRHLSLEDFYDFMYSTKLTPDELVTYLTQDV